MQHLQATSAPTRGYSADTEILTRRGWITFDQLTYLDEVATRSPEGRFEWEHPLEIIWRQYDGEMIRLHGRDTDLLVMPGHPVLWLPGSQSEPLISSAAEILCRPGRPSWQPMAGRLLATSAWEAPDVTEKIFPGIRHAKKGPRPRDVGMSGDRFAAFMGMYMAEGNATRAIGGRGGASWLVEISQTPGGKGYDEYRDLLTGIFGREPGKGNYGTTWVMHSRAMYDYLRPLGKARHKELPPEITAMSRRQLEIFWAYYFLGDGCYERRVSRTEHEVVATASWRFADQLQEVIQKLGTSASVRRYKTRATSLVKTEGVIYKLRIRHRATPAFRIGSAPYVGAVGHVRVPGGIVYVRRNGIPAWCG